MDDVLANEFTSANLSIQDGEWPLDGEQGPSDDWDWVFTVNDTTTGDSGISWLSKYAATHVPSISAEDAVLAVCPSWYTTVFNHINGSRISSKLNKGLADHYVWLKSFFCDYFIGVGWGYLRDAFDIADAEDSTVEVISLQNPACIERWKEVIED